MSLGLDEAVGKLLDAPLWATSDTDLAEQTAELLRAHDRIEALICNNLNEVGARGLTDPGGRLVPTPAGWLRTVAGVPIGLSAARKISRRAWTRSKLVTLAALHQESLSSCLCKKCC